MKTILLIFLALGLSTLSFSQKDSLFVFKLKAIPDTSIEGVQGFYTVFSMRFVYDTLYHNRQYPASFWLDAEIYVNGKALPAIKSTNAFKNSKENAGYRTYLRQSGVTVKRSQYPYYALDLKEGKYQIEIKIKAWQNDTSITEENPHRVKITGDSVVKMTVNIPPKEYFKVLVSGVRALETDFEGDVWDYNLISGAPPDICWKVSAGDGESTDYFYSSPIVKNSYSAAWLDDTGELCVSKGDKFFVKVYDNDPMYDDLMSLIHVNIFELLEISAKNKEMVLGRLSYFKVSAEKLR